MMWKTFTFYSDIITGKTKTPEGKQYVTWESLDKFADTWVVRLSWVGIYFAFYYHFAPHPLYFLLVPVHAMMGPIHGMIVNWCGHKYGYSNYQMPDQSKNTLPFDFLMMGELYQNNHHRFGSDSNFAKKWFEVDLTYLFMKPLFNLGVIHRK